MHEIFFENMMKFLYVRVLIITQNNTFSRVRNCKSQIFETNKNFYLIYNRKYNYTFLN